MTTIGLVNGLRTSANMKPAAEVTVMKQVSSCNGALVAQKNKKSKDDFFSYEKISKTAGKNVQPFGGILQRRRR